jgi:CBS domain-containing protein
MPFLDAARRSMSSVGEFMHRGLISCEDRTPIAKVANVLVSRRIHAVAVVDEDGQARGILSDFDLLAAEWLSVDAEAIEALKAMTAGELMSSPLSTIDVEASPEEAVVTLLQKQISRLIVVEAKQPIGMLTISDLVAVLGRASGERTTVADVMSEGFVICRPNASVRGVARAMTERHSRSVVVLDVASQAVGIVTGRDLLAAYVEGSERPVTELMNPPLTITADAPLTSAADTMLEHETHRLVVVDSPAPNATPVGLISTADLMAEMAAPQSIWQEE